MTSPQELIKAAQAAGRKALDERSGKALLAAHGVRVPRTVVVPGAKDLKAAAELTYPVVVKVVSPDILHKSDAGGVAVGLKNAAEVAAAIERMAQQPAIQAARVEGYLVEEMAPAGQELVIGGLIDPQFGPLVMVGLGGIFVEVLADVAFRICPIERIDAEEMLDELKGAAVLKGARGRPAASREAIIDVLLKVGGANGVLVQHPEIKEADINPLIVSADSAVAVDARFIIG